MMKYCSNCGAKVDLRIPEGDDLPRYVCGTCHRIHYENPKVVVGCIPEWEDKILICRRAIAPQLGKWTLPAGYLENGETLAEGAQRETREETDAAVEIIEPYAIFNIASINQIYMMFRGRLASAHFTSTSESSKVMLVDEKDIPWDDLAFIVIRETLTRYFEDRRNGSFQFQMGDIVPPSPSYK